MLKILVRATAIVKKVAMMVEESQLASGKGPREALLIWGAERSYIFLWQDKWS
jgi:hypothetical protein